MHWNTIKFKAVDQSTIQFWTLLATGDSAKASNYPIIKSLKILKYATYRDSYVNWGNHNSLVDSFHSILFYKRDTVQLVSVDATIYSNFKHLFALENMKKTGLKSCSHLALNNFSVLPTSQKPAQISIFFCVKIALRTTCVQWLFLVSRTGLFVSLRVIRVEDLHVIY